MRGDGEATNGDDGVASCGCHERPWAPGLPRGSIEGPPLWRAVGTPKHETETSESQSKARKAANPNARRPAQPLLRIFAAEGKVTAVLYMLGIGAQTTLRPAV
jgi:hypothetical protein